MALMFDSILEQSILAKETQIGIRENTKLSTNMKSDIILASMTALSNLIEICPATKTNKNLIIDVNIFKKMAEYIDV